MLASPKSYFHICFVVLALALAVNCESKRENNISGKYRRAAGYYTTRFGRSDPSLRLQELEQKRQDHIMEKLMRTSFVPDLPEKAYMPLETSAEEMKHIIDDILEEKPMLFCTFSKERMTYVCSKVPWMVDIGRVR